MESLFSRLFKYRSSEKRIQQENFLTEIFAFLLENVPGLLPAFLNKCDIIVQNQPEKIRVESQLSFSTYPERIQPDISIRFSTDNQRWLVFIENKISAAEGEDQLKRYLSYLEKEAKNNTNCILLYVTRFHDPKNISSMVVTFGQIRWWQIYEILATFEDNPFVTQTRLYMNENDLNMSRNFSFDHITAMMKWRTVREMMDTSLGDNVEKRFVEVTGGRYRTDWIEKNFREWWDYFHAIGYLLCFEMGYFIENSRDENYPEVGGAIIVQPEHPKRSQVVQALHGFNLRHNSWELSENFTKEDEEVWIAKGRSLQEFLGMDDHISAIQRWFLEVLSDVEAFQKDYRLKWD
ncbi:MAG: PD-(D/E)XK nuclease family protein [Anaerolineales bacterium]|nr:PD-(D/E)XK nuclease family protein [Anaerolineales bacterium]